MTSTVTDLVTRTRTCVNSVRTADPIESSRYSLGSCRENRYDFSYLGRSPSKHKEVVGVSNTTDTQLPDS